MKACFIITTVSFNYEKSNWLCSCRLALENVSFCFSQHVQHLGLSCMSIFCEKGWMLRLLHNSVAGSCIVFTAAEEIKFPKRCHDVFFATILSLLSPPWSKLWPQLNRSTAWQQQQKKRKCVCTKAQEMKGRKKWGSQSGKSQWGHCFSQLRPKKTNIIGTLQGKSGRREV